MDSSFRQEDTVKVVSWNVFREPVKWPWDARKDVAFAKLRSFDADIIALQELHGPTFESDFGEFLADTWQAVVQKSSPGKRNWCGLLFRKDRFSLDMVVSKSAGIVVGLKDNQGRPLWVVVVHLNSSPAGLEFGPDGEFTRYSQMRSLLVKGVSSKCGHPKECPPLLVCGDFNCQASEMPHVMLREGHLDPRQQHSEPRYKKTKPYDTGWRLLDLYQDVTPRPFSFLSWMHEEGGDTYHEHFHALRQASRHLTSGGHFNLDKYICWIDFKEYMSSRNAWGYTQDWNPAQSQRNWYCEREIIDAILCFAYGHRDSDSRRCEDSLDYIYYAPNHFEKIRHTLPCSEELLKYCCELHPPNKLHSSDHFPVCVELKRV